MDFDEEMKESDEIGKADVGDSEFHERESDGINARESQKAIDQEEGSMEKKGESMLTGEKEASNETGKGKTKKSNKTKTPRGPTRNLQLAKMRPGEKIKVDFDFSGQPIGVNRAKLSSYCGSLVRDPMNAPLYRIEEFSQDKFDIGLDDVKDQDEREKKRKDKRKKKFRKEAEASKNEASEAKKEANEVKEKNEALSNTVRDLERNLDLWNALEAFMNLAGYNMSDLNMDAWTDEEDEEELIQKSEKKHNDVED
ncbi:uncharacterized protein LOC125497720 [Beta vulgaris subsp. vulgaris]|uniref:uncharacterized protein LOC125497720 n=1 Tax=Beta vulgaris subsp. vulgaris TaxID=3555 RepID=UPI002548B2BD|nr:uncharacterized protein LOC125497720 [Beta vulgaris subsp. vulgaris]